MAAAGPFCFTPVAETDLGWHLALGRLISTSGLPNTNSLAWTEPAFPFYATSWLFDLSSYGVAQAAGLLGLQTFIFALVTLTLLAVTAACAAVSERAFWVPLAVAWLCVPRITIRPHQVSWLLLAACVALGLWALKVERPWLRVVTVPLIALGSNFHAGAIFTSVALGAFCVDAALRHRRWAAEGATAIAGALALTVNPGGPYNVWYALTHLKLYQALPINELLSPRLSELPAFWASLPPVLALALLSRKRHLSLLLLASLFAVAGAFAARLAFKYYLVAAPALAAGTELLAPRSRRALAGALLLLAASTNVPRYMHLELGSRWDPAAIPTRATDFIVKHKLTGRFYNSFGDGGYLAWALPAVPVFQDARALAYSPDFFRQQLDAEGSPKRFDALMRRLGVEWALTSSTPGALTGAGLLPEEGWALVYWDDANEVRLRRDVGWTAPPIEALAFRYLRPERDAREIVTTILQADAGESLRVADELSRATASGLSPALEGLFACALSLKAPNSTPAPSCAVARADFPGLLP